MRVASDAPTDQALGGVNGRGAKEDTAQWVSVLV